MALLYPFNTVLSTQNDADSPLTEDWGESMRQNAIHLKQVLYGDGSGGFKTAADGHTHNGTDSVGVVVPNDSIGRNAINHAASASSWNIGISGTQVIGEGFFMGIWDSSPGTDARLEINLNGSWRAVDNDMGTTAAASIYSDGTNYRIRNVNAGAGIIVYFRKMDA